MPALVVPFAAPGEDEQARRAPPGRTGAVRVLDPAELTASGWPPRSSTSPTRRPRALDIDLDGARASAEVVWGMHRRRVRRTEAVVA